MHVREVIILAESPIQHQKLICARTWQVDPFVTRPLGLAVHRFRTENRGSDAILELEAA